MTVYRRSKELGTVVQSVNIFGEAICVDFFQREDGSFGFEEYRRDSETAEGWFPIGFHSGKLYTSLTEAQAAAKLKIAWLEDEM